MRRNNSIVNWIWTAVLLMALWFVMSEKTEPKFLIIGAVSSLVISAVCIRTMTSVTAKSGEPYFILNFSIFRFIVYFFWLMWQIIKSAVYVSRVSLSDKSSLDPGIVWFRADYDSPTARSILANSITLTPGTITIDITEDGIYSVHALTEELRAGVLDGSMQHKIAWLFGEKIDFAPVDTVTVDADPSDITHLKIKPYRRRGQ